MLLTYCCRSFSHVSSYNKLAACLHAWQLCPCLLLLNAAHDVAEGDDTSSTPEGIASEASDQGPSTAIDNDAQDASDVVVLSEVPKTDKQALHSDASNNSHGAEPDDESAAPLVGNFLASCAVHTCFILKCFESV